MGTNYYLEAEEPCDKCGHQPSRLHIGKSSYGWYFTMHIIPEEGINTLGDWIKLMESGRQIVDEYGQKLTVGDMMDVIVNRKRPDPYVSGYKPTAKTLKENDAVWCSRYNLMRYSLNSGFAYGHGDGCWTYVAGDFS